MVDQSETELLFNGAPTRRRRDEELADPRVNGTNHSELSNPSPTPEAVITTSPAEIVMGDRHTPIPEPTADTPPRDITAEGIWMVAKNLTTAQKQILEEFKTRHNEISIESRGEERVITGIEDAKIAAELAILLAKDTKVKLKDESQGKVVSEKIVYKSGAIHHNESDNKLTVGLNNITATQKDLVKQALITIEARDISEVNNNTITATLERSKYLSLSDQPQLQPEQTPPPVTEAPNTNNANLYSQSDVSPPINTVSQNNVVFDTNAAAINLDTLQPTTNQEPPQNMVVTSQIPGQHNIPDPVVIGASHLGQLSSPVLEVSR